MGMLFLNAPVRNGEFTLTELPGKATGIRIAAALNQIMGAPPAPHLWNTATLAATCATASTPPQAARCPAKTSTPG